MTRKGTIKVGTQWMLTRARSDSIALMVTTGRYDAVTGLDDIWGRVWGSQDQVERDKLCFRDFVQMAYLRYGCSHQVAVNIWDTFLVVHLCVKVDFDTHIERIECIRILKFVLSCTYYVSA